MMCTRTIGLPTHSSGGIAAVTKGRAKVGRLQKLWCDSGFKKTFLDFCSDNDIAAEVVHNIHPGKFVVEPQRGIVERTWSWFMNSRRLQVDYERDPAVTEGFIWAAQTRLLRRRLTAHPA